MSNSNQEELPELMDGKFKKHLQYVFIACFLLACLPFVLTREEWFNLNFSDTGQIGDTIGGIMGPFIAMGAAILTYMAYHVQLLQNNRILETITISIVH